jgi:adenine-specific DNA-methyltransferase
MPTLNWVGKDKVINHHHDVPFRVLKHEKRFDSPKDALDNSINNKIIHGDNLEALKSLLPEFEGVVNCIYIDPPYNTGNEGWVYNDNVSDPKLKKWLGEVVGKENEDLSRHDKWLCMIYPRLKLLHKLLANDGIIFVSIDDNESSTLRLVLDEIFGAGNFLANVVWQKRTSPDARLNLGPAHDHIIVYAKNLQKAKENLNKIPLSAERSKAFKNPDKDPRGLWASVDLTGQTGHATSEQYFEINTPDGRKVKPPRNRCWALAEATYLNLAKDNRIWFGKDGKARPRLKSFLSESEGSNLWTWWTNEEVGHNQEATKELLEIFGVDAQFETPKPVRLIERILQLASKKNSIILDSFAGSGTTAHATLRLNARDGGNRRFILTEMMDYADTTTAERVRRVMTGYGEGDKATQGLGGGFDYYTVGEPIFLDADTLNEAVGIEAIRSYVAYSEGVPEADRVPPINQYTPHLLGLNSETAWVFNYDPADATSLDMAFLKTLKFGKAKPALAIIYADRCLLSKDFMSKHSIIFKKIPRDITRF